MLSKFSRSNRIFAANKVKYLSATTSNTNLLEGFGDHLFKGAVALPYLKKHGLSANVLDTGKWTTDGNADKVLNQIDLKCS